MYIRYVGSNRRYGSDVTDETLARFMVRPEPESLAREQCGDAVTQAQRPIAVSAWVRFDGKPERVQGLAIAWTKVAVCVEWPASPGVHRAWLWASAVDRI